MFICIVIYIFSVFMSIRLISYYLREGWRATYNCNWWHSGYTIIVILPVINLIASFQMYAEAKGWD